MVGKDEEKIERKEGQMKRRRVNGWKEDKEIKRKGRRGGE